MSRFRTIFPDVAKPLIAMAHVPPLPGTPLYDAAAGVQGLIDHVKRDTEKLLDGGFDAILFCNEGDRPYQLNAGLEASAVMARVAAECRPADRPFGVDFLWDAQCALAIAVGSGAFFMREVITGSWESDMGPWNPDAATLPVSYTHLDVYKRQLDISAGSRTRPSPPHSWSAGSTVERVHRDTRPSRLHGLSTNQRLQ